MCSFKSHIIEEILMSTRNIPFSIKKKENHPKWLQICSYGIFSRGLKNELVIALVNESSMFEPLKVLCILLS